MRSGSAPRSLRRDLIRREFNTCFLDDPDGERLRTRATAADVSSRGPNCGGWSHRSVKFGGAPKEGRSETACVHRRNSRRVQRVQRFHRQLVGRKALKGGPGNSRSGGRSEPPRQRRRSSADPDGFGDLQDPRR